MKLTDYFRDWLKVIDVLKLAKVVTILHFMLVLVLLCLNKVFTEINSIMIGNYGTPI